MIKKNQKLLAEVGVWVYRHSNELQTLSEAPAPEGSTAKGQHGRTEKRTRQTGIWLKRRIPWYFQQLHRNTMKLVRTEVPNLSAAWKGFQGAV